MRMLLFVLVKEVCQCLYVLCVSLVLKTFVHVFSSILNYINSYLQKAYNLERVLMSTVVINKADLQTVTSVR